MALIIRTLSDEAERTLAEFQNSNEEEINEDLIGKPFDFQFKNEGIVTCIDVVFPERLGYCTI